SNPAVVIVANTLGGNDTEVIGSPSSPASGLAASFTVDGGTGINSLVIDDTADATGRTVTITPGGISGLTGSQTFSNLTNLQINAGSGGDTFNVQGTANATGINAGGGNDTVAFGDGATL